MRRVFVLSLMMLLAPVVTAHADPINLGFISFDELLPPEGDSPGTNTFSIANLTGDPASGGFGLPGDFPVFSSILFANSILSVVQNGSTTDFLLGDIGPGFFQSDALQFLTSAQISSATFMAQIGPLVFTLADGTTWASNSGSVMAALLPSNGSFLSAGLDLALLTVDADRETTPPTSVPEPQVWLLIGGGIAIAAGCRARARSI
jgi:hypothetical protein